MFHQWRFSVTSYLVRHQGPQQRTMCGVTSLSIYLLPWSLRVISSLFLLQHHPWIKHECYKNRENDQQPKKFLIVTQILLFSTLGNEQRTVIIFYSKRNKSDWDITRWSGKLLWNDGKVILVRNFSFKFNFIRDRVSFSTILTMFSPHYWILLRFKSKKTKDPLNEFQPALHCWKLIWITSNSLN